MDQQKLRSHVFERTGVKLGLDDPAFALVALNEAVLADTMEKHLALLEEARQELAAVHAALDSKARPARSKAAKAAAEAQAAAPAPAPAPRWRPELRTAAIAGASAIVGGLLVALIARPPALSSEQRAALEQADKLHKAVQTLDAKTRAALDTELKK